jgi:hypothetical protein
VEIAGAATGAVLRADEERRGTMLGGRSVTPVVSERVPAVANGLSSAGCSPAATAATAAAPAAAAAPAESGVAEVCSVLGGEVGEGEAQVLLVAANGDAAIAINYFYDGRLPRLMRRFKARKKDGEDSQGERRRGGARWGKEQGAVKEEVEEGAPPGGDSRCVCVFVCVCVFACACLLCVHVRINCALVCVRVV